MKHTLQLSILLLYLFIAQACVAQNSAEPDQVLPEGYQSCCGTEPVTFKNGKTSIYVSNVFTPNGDGINDTFLPSINSEVLTLVNFTILTPGKDTVLYHTLFVDVSRMKEYAWNGKNWHNGIVYSGPFVYGMEVMDRDEKPYVVEGMACSIPCKKEMQVFKTKEGCYYPAQAGKNGDLDTRLSNAEKDCF